ncbi:MAG: carboxypeptidase-like regulatory domain-containing protein [Pyrinomonadaceae bacterium]
MNAKQQAKSTMYQSVEKHCEDNPDITATNVAFQTAFNNFKTKIVAIGAAAQEIELPLTGLTAGKKASKQDLCELAADTASLIYAFAETNGNAALKDGVDYSLSALLRTKDSLLALRCQNIHDKGVENKDALEDYGVTTKALADLQAAITSYTATSPKPRAARSQRSTLKNNVVQLFREADNILKNQMDKLIVAFRKTHPDFYNTYFKLRDIPESRTTTTQLKGVITNSADETPVKNAFVTVVEIARTAKTKSTGEYCFKPLPNGTFTVRVTAEGFKDCEKDEVEIKLGVVNSLNITMETA